MGVYPFVYLFGYLFIDLSIYFLDSRHLPVKSLQEEKQACQQKYSSRSTRFIYTDVTGFFLLFLLLSFFFYWLIL